MSLNLVQSNGIVVKTGLPCACHGRGKVNIYRPESNATQGNPEFDACVTMHDFVAMVQYVLENTPLEGSDDPRAILLEYARSMKVRRVHKEGLRIVSTKRRNSAKVRFGPS